MRLEALAYVANECDADMLRQIGLPVYELQELSWEELDRLEVSGEELLLLAARDETIRAADRMAIAVAAYRNADFPGESLSGAGMVIEGFEEVDASFLEKVYNRCHHIPWVIAETERCVIRELAMQDIDALFALYSQPGITHFVEPLYSKNEESRFQEAYISNMYGYYGYGMWLVTEKESGEVIGRAGLEHREFTEGIELELGYVIAPKWQRKGIATEVCTAILTFAETELDFPRINALTDPKNTASSALLQKLGFRYLEDTGVTGSRLRRYVRRLNHKNRQSY